VSEPQSGNRASNSLGNSGLWWTVFAQNRDTAVPAEGNGDLQTLICVLVARPRWCLSLSNPVPWWNWMAAYLNYTLRMKTLFCGWPVMVDDTHMRRRSESLRCHNEWVSLYSVIMSEWVLKVSQWMSESLAAFEKSCRLIRLIWSPLLPFVYSIVSIQSIWICVCLLHCDYSEHDLNAQIKDGGRNGCVWPADKTTTCFIVRWGKCKI